MGYIWIFGQTHLQGKCLWEVGLDRSEELMLRQPETVSQIAFRRIASRENNVHPLV